MTTISKFTLLFLILPVFVFGQNKTFEIFGNITGEYKGKIYLFYENQFSRKDSISTLIKNGKFYFKEKAVLPILCRFHFGGKTNVRDLYIDNDRTLISLSSNITEKDTPDSLGGARTHFEIVNVKGSKTQNIIDAFETWKRRSQKTNQSAGQKASNYFGELQSIVTKYPKSKASAYLVAGGGFLMGSRFMLLNDFPLQYSQVNELKSLLDTSLKDTYEWQNVTGLLNSLKKVDKKIIGNSFYNVIS